MTERDLRRVRSFSKIDIITASTIEGKRDGGKASLLCYEEDTKAVVFWDAPVRFDHIQKPTLRNEAIEKWKNSLGNVWL